jgi:hypothetical protein
MRLDGCPGRWGQAIRPPVLPVRMWSIAAVRDVSPGIPLVGNPLRRPQAGARVGRRWVQQHTPVAPRAATSKAADSAVTGVVLSACGQRILCAHPAEPGCTRSPGGRLWSGRGADQIFGSL